MAEIFKKILRANKDFWDKAEAKISGKPEKEPLTKHATVQDRLKEIEFSKDELSGIQYDANLILAAQQLGDVGLLQKVSDSIHYEGRRKAIMEIGWGDYYKRQYGEIFSRFASEKRDDHMKIPGKIIHDTEEEAIRATRMEIAKRGREEEDKYFRTFDGVMKKISEIIGIPYNEKISRLIIKMPKRAEAKPEAAVAPEVLKAVTGKTPEIDLSNLSKIDITILEKYAGALAKTARGERVDKAEVDEMGRSVLRLKQEKAIEGMGPEWGGLLKGKMQEIFKKIAEEKGINKFPPKVKNFSKKQTEIFLAALEEAKRTSVDKILPEISRQGKGEDYGNAFEAVLSQIDEMVNKVKEKGKK